MEKIKINRNTNEQMIFDNIVYHVLHKFVNEIKRFRVSYLWIVGQDVCA